MCPLLQRKSGDVCVQVMNKVNKVTLDFRLNLVSTVRQSESNIGNTMHSVFDDRICQVSIGREQLTTDAYVYPILVYVSSPEFTNIRDEMDRVKLNIERFNTVVNKEEKFELDFPKLLENFTDTHTSIILSKKSSKHFSCEETVLSMTDMQFCYGVNLRYAEPMSEGRVYVGNVILGPGEFVYRVNKNGSELSVFTCLSTYLSLVLGKETIVHNPFIDEHETTSLASIFRPCTILVVIAYSSFIEWYHLSSYCIL